MSNVTTEPTSLCADKEYKNQKWYMLCVAFATLPKLLEWVMLPTPTQRIFVLWMKNTDTRLAQFLPYWLSLWALQSTSAVVPFPVPPALPPKSALSFSCSVAFSPSSTSQPPVWRSGSWLLCLRSHMAGWLFFLGNTVKFVSFCVCWLAEGPASPPPDPSAIDPWHLHW